MRKQGGAGGGWRTAVVVRGTAAVLARRTHLNEVLLVLVAVHGLLDLNHLAELRELDGAAAVCGEQRAKGFRGGVSRAHGTTVEGLRGTFGYERLQEEAAKGTAHLRRPP